MKQRWRLWKKEMLHLMRTKYSEVYGKILSRDIDWVAWREFYNDDYSPDDAINVELSYID